MPLGVPMMVAPGIAVLPTRGGDGESAWVANIYFQAAQLPARAVIYGDALVLPKCDISLACRALAPNGDLLMEFAFGELPGAAAERQR